MDDYIKETDIKMYHYKKTHKRPLFEMYHDDRLPVEVEERTEEIEEGSPAL